MDRWARARKAEGRIPICNTPHTDIIMARTAAGENLPIASSFSGSRKYIYISTLR
jgi:hypothetical protein